MRSIGSPIRTLPSGSADRSLIALISHRSRIRQAARRPTDPPRTRRLHGRSFREDGPGTRSTPCCRGLLEAEQVESWWSPDGKHEIDLVGLSRRRTPSRLTATTVGLAEPKAGEDRPPWPASRPKGPGVLAQIHHRTQIEPGDLKPRPQARISAFAEFLVGHCREKIAERRRKKPRRRGRRWACHANTSSR